MNTFKGSANPAEVFSGTGRIQSAPGTVPAGYYGYLITGWPDAGNKPFTIFGVINLDGAGNLNGSSTLVNGRPRFLGHSRAPIPSILMAPAV